MDRYKLEYEIKSNGYTVAEFCEKLGISRSAYHRKVKGKTEFTLTEIKSICSILNIDSPMDIFFTDKVS